MNIIHLENIGKKFTLKLHSENPLENLFSKFSDSKLTEEYWALRNINMEVEQGKIIGIIGRNGAGKTTLLNILAGICTPSEGKININGRVSSILTLGAGFKNELSGRENIYLNGLVLGMTRKEISTKFKNIVDFSELDGFLKVPLQTYSQGMRVRLGFSVAINVEFDVLLVDEIIAVGDCSFQKKCLEAMCSFKKQGKTMVFSTQDTGFIERICDEVYVLENGEIEFSGGPEVAIQCYQKLLDEKRFSKHL
ncbi:MAG: ABC transporter ATP-binding protein [Candidatus Omnitrophica bacterium]|nr:ABC transporter ATP-binding protein [Candidatus Omnitrophota bacterium]